MYYFGGVVLRVGKRGLEGRGSGRVGRVGPEGVLTCHFCTKKNHLR